jgi:hypothetical protein
MHIVLFENICTVNEPIFYKKMLIEAKKNLAYTVNIMRLRFWPFLPRLRIIFFVSTAVFDC